MEYIELTEQLKILPPKAVRWNNSYTIFIKIRSGDLQGEPLSPYLFLVFINYLSKIFDDSNLPGIYLPNF
ncbi:hypothetical protein LAZ67_11003261 [Cordylochernes scorpioides]|uniref:Reverse transcriptase domain-containing protein n=1 Tax=Cordylochernes scorpioides TaxID=51811 RepID=A0ABY6KZQ9_9ARAC|nr:hypothetical protein LAZ67_11003261 [Cordylochernes scorpioides]